MGAVRPSQLLPCGYPCHGYDVFLFLINFEDFGLLFDFKSTLLILPITANKDCCSKTKQIPSKINEKWYFSNILILAVNVSFSYSNISKFNAAP